MTKAAKYEYIGQLSCVLTEIFVALLNTRTILELSIILEHLHDDALNGGGGLPHRQSSVCK
jgi:hypothetical protein